MAPLYISSVEEARVPYSIGLNGDYNINALYVRYDKDIQAELLAQCSLEDLTIKSYYTLICYLFNFFEGAINS